MTEERWTQLMRDDGELTLEEVTEGWHYCPEWDGLLIGPGMGELEFCTCEMNQSPRL